MGKKKLTIEEKKLLKAEKKKKLAEQKKQFKRDHLEREIKYGALTVKKYEKNWRDMLMKIKTTRLKQDLEFAWHNFERSIDSKDFTISLLLDEIHDAENQYSLNLNTHMEQIDNLILLFSNQITELKSDYEKEVAEFEQKNQTDINMITTVAEENENYLKTIIYGLELAKKEQDAMIRADYYSKLDEESNKSNDIVGKLRSHLENDYNKILTATTTFLNDYKQQTETRKKNYNDLKEQDNTIQILISEREEHIQKNLEYIKKLKEKLSNCQQNEKISNLTIERDFFANACNELKNKLEIDRNTDHNQIVVLSDSCRNTLEDLHKLVKRGENILKLTAVCRKLETEEEKILPFPVENKKTLDTQNNLELFWQKIGQAEGSLFALNSEKEFLLAENEDLKKKVANYYAKLKYSTDTNEKKIKSSGLASVVNADLEMKKYSNYQFMM